jgi:hypothetical protein
MINKLIPKGNTNQKDIEIPCHSFRMVMINETTNAGEDVWKLESFHNAWEYKLVQPLWKS